MADLRASRSAGLVGNRVWRWSGWGQNAFCLMKAARRLISGDGELESGWKRLFGFNSGLSWDSIEWFDRNPRAVRNPVGSFLTVCPNDEIVLLLGISWKPCVLICVAPASLDLSLGPVERCLRAAFSRVENTTLRDALGELFRACKQAWQVYGSRGRMVSVSEKKSLP